jgi:hypothetical protein
MRIFSAMRGAREKPIAAFLWDGRNQLFSGDAGTREMISAAPYTLPRGSSRNSSVSAPMIFYRGGEREQTQ